MEDQQGDGTIGGNYPCRGDIPIRLGECPEDYVTEPAEHRELLYQVVLDEVERTLESKNWGYCRLLARGRELLCVSDSL